MMLLPRRREKKSRSMTKPLQQAYKKREARAVVQSLHGLVQEFLLLLLLEGIGDEVEKQGTNDAMMPRCVVVARLTVNLVVKRTFVTPVQKHGLQLVADRPFMTGAIRRNGHDDGHDKFILLGRTDQRLALVLYS
jgi:hypothetical protein